MRIAECGLWNEIKDGMQDMACEFATPNTGPATPNSNGFTLIEIVMTIVLISILGGLAAVIILQGVRAYSDEDSRSDIHYQTRIAVERIARESRQISDCTTINVPANPGGTFSFLDINTGLTVTFSISGTDLLRNADRLASGINSAQSSFSFLATNGTLTTLCPAVWFIDISVTDQNGTQSLPVRTRVHPRNFTP
jgi:prepilin-type N-terminal cleavage/methylation domain-containing protein